MERCEACTRPGTFEDPTYKYENGASYHDQCAEEIGMPESEML